MKLSTMALSSVLLMTGSLTGQQNDITPHQLVTWMRNVDTLEVEYKTVNGRFADETELLTFLKTVKKSGAAIAKELSPTSMQPYQLHIVVNKEGSHYLATINFPSDMHDKSTWCKTHVFSGDSGLISLGQNIGCSGANALNVFSKPSQ